MKQMQQLIGVADLPVTFLETGTGFDAQDYLAPFPGRDVDVEPLINLFEEAMRRFRDNPEASDAWVAPRLHHTLRLTRREAARRGVWAWLAVVAVPEFVHWRFPGKSGATDIDRYLGREDKNAVGRLWWGAELMRNGEDYAPVKVGFALQDVPNTWMRLDAFHVRPLVQAVLGELATYNSGKPATSDQVNAVAKAVNTAARTVLLDAVTTDPALDSLASQAWLDGADQVDETELYASEPEGPLDEAVPKQHIDVMKEFVVGVIARMPAHRPRVEHEELSSLA